MLVSKPIATSKEELPLHILTPKRCYPCTMPPFTRHDSTDQPLPANSIKLHLFKQLTEL
jgi:hypothetical protein